MAVNASATKSAVGPPGGGPPPRRGASRSGNAGTPSLDTGKQLATTDAYLPSCYEQDQAEKTEYDLYRDQVRLQRQLNQSVHKLWQDYQAAGDMTEAAKWEKTWLRLHACQSEWVGYRADCCGASTRPVAVPIGCNNRLCPLCAFHRSSVARRRIKTMFDRLTHPAMITLTVPNLGAIRKHDFTKFRQRTRKFLARHKSWILGGVYSMETTYNRREKTWHIHAHILCDLQSSLPSKMTSGDDGKKRWNTVDLAGERTLAFTALKLRLEFDWLRLWTNSWGKPCRTDAVYESRQGETRNFEDWVRLGRAHRVREYCGGQWRVMPGLSDAEIARRTAWNTANRRVVDIRPVLDRDGAAREVLKYITKVAGFSDCPEAVEAFLNATKGARMIQTFGTWYGVKLDAKPNPDALEDWGEMKCSCGCNFWRRMGVFHRHDVQMDQDGRWRLTASFDHNARGTVPRPTIRALDEREERLNHGSL